MGTAAGWIEQIGHACLWGSLWIAVAGLLSRFMPCLSASIRAWLWWLACLEMLLSLCVTAPLSLPVLPAPPRTAYAAVQPASTLPIPLHQPVKFIVPAHSAPGDAAEAASPISQTPRWPLFVLTVWLGGTAASFGVVAWQSLTLQRLRRSTVPAVLPAIDIDALARLLGLRSVPRVLTGPGIQTPCVTGCRHPAILLPVGLSEMLTADEMRLTLAHEMAHIKRLDLPLAAVPILARILFFFHPLVWWAAAEWGAAREEACDRQALSATSLPRADYGRLLLKLADPAAAAPALGLSPGYRNLRRRLLGLSRAQTSSRRAGLFVLALPLLLPWRLTAALSPTAAQDYHATARLYAIQVLADGMESDAAAVNDAGQVALSVHSSGMAQGYAGSGDVLAPTGTLPKHHASLAYGLNTQGQVAGTSFNIPGHGRAFFWDGVPHRVGSLPGYPYSEARGLNDAGQLAGFSETGRADRFHAWVTRAFLRQPGAPMTDLGTLGGPYSAAYGINSRGTVVGKADTESFGATHAFAWTNDRMTDLGTLGGENSAAYAVSDTDQIAGASEVDDTGTRHAFLYSDGRMQDLGPLAGMTGSAAYALNNSGQIVGVSQSGNIKRATLWQNDQPTDLNSLLPPHSGWTLTEARAINNHGQIAGSGLLHGKPCAFLLTPATRR